MPLMKKNFTYGDLWVGDVITDENGSLKRVEPSEVTSNVMFLNWLKENNYSVYLDYSGYYAGLNGHPGVAKTMIDARRIIINGNYSKVIQSALLKHEMGHLILFGCNQFTSVKEDTMRSVLAKILYTPENLTDYGIEQLLYTENVIQDIVIETFSGNECLCSNFMTEKRHNIGVKHLDELESIALITKEVCKNNLRKDLKNPVGSFSNGDLEKIKELLESMLKELEKDLLEILEKKDDIDDISGFRREVGESLRRDMRKIASTERKVENSLSKAKEGSELQGKLQEALKKLAQDKKDLIENNSIEEMERKAQESQKRAQDYIQKKLDKGNELRDRLLEELENFKNELDSRGDSGNSGGSNGSNGSNGSDGSDGEGNGGSGGTSSDGGEGSDDAQGSGDGKGNSRNSENAPPMDEKGTHLDKNFTDHLGGEEGSPTNFHSCDCGFPLPITVTNEESSDNQNSFTPINGKVKIKKLIVQNDSGDDIRGGRKKSFEKELTYFRSSKKEFGNEDMLKGKKKIFLSGINVLIGLDVSGSMSMEWTRKFQEISDLVEKLRKELEIDSVHYFTYNSSICESSEDIKDMKLQARGGNAFPYVYQEMMQKLPLKSKNEIILVTDCGDNLGFKLNDVCIAQKGEAEVENHVSVIDTQGAGFIDASNVNWDDWSFYNYSDPTLNANIKNNIENLIDRI